MAWTRSLLDSKLKALAIHLSVSALIFIPILALIWFAWFPPPFFFTDGGWQGVRIMLLVDMVIGPALTFLVFNPAKTRRALAVDYTFIALVQVAALIYGYISVESKRVMAIAYYDGAFAAITQDRFKEQQFDHTEWTRLGEKPPYWVYVRPPKAGEEQMGVVNFAMTGGLSPQELFFLYDPLQTHAAQLFVKGVEYSELLKQEENLALHSQSPPEGVRFFRLDGYYRIAYLGLDEQMMLVTTLYRD